MLMDFGRGCVCICPSFVSSSFSILAFPFQDFNRLHCTFERRCFCAHLELRRKQTTLSRPSKPHKLILISPNLKKQNTRHRYMVKPLNGLFGPGDLRRPFSMSSGPQTDTGNSAHRSPSFLSLGRMIRVHLQPKPANAINPCRTNTSVPSVSYRHSSVSLGENRTLGSEVVDGGHLQLSTCMGSHGRDETRRARGSQVETIFEFDV